MNDKDIIRKLLKDAGQISDEELEKAKQQAIKDIKEELSE